MECDSLLDKHKPICSDTAGVTVRTIVSIRHIVLV